MGHLHKERNICLMGSEIILSVHTMCVQPKVLNGKPMMKF